MKTRMLSGALTKGVLAACVALSLAVCAGAQPASEGNSAAESASRSSGPGGIPIAQLIAAVAKSSGKKFVVDPRVRAEVDLVGISPSSVSYPEFLTILEVHGFVAFDQGGIVSVVPDAAARVMPSTLLTDRETRPDSEIVTETVHLKNSPAMRLVPLLRPLFPQNAHLVADICSNSLVMVDRFANVKRIAAIVQRLDVGEPYKPQACEAREMNQPREAQGK